MAFGRSSCRWQVRTPACEQTDERLISSWRSLGTTEQLEPFRPDQVACPALVSCAAAIAIPCDADEALTMHRAPPSVCEAIALRISEHSTARALDELCLEPLCSRTCPGHWQRCLSLQPQVLLPSMARKRAPIPLALPAKSFLRTQHSRSKTVAISSMNSYCH